MMQETLPLAQQPAIQKNDYQCVRIQMEHLLKKQTNK